MPQIDCGIDIGSTNLKIILVTDGGEILYTKAVPTPRVHDGVGSATDPLALVALLEDMIVEGWRSVADGQPLRSLAAAGVGEDGVGVGLDLKPTGAAIAWFDMRASEEASWLAARFGAFSDVAGISIAADRTVAKWLWIHNNRPDELASPATWITLTDFPAVWWTGRTFISASLAPRTACFDLSSRRWIDSLTAAVHAPRLPPILGAGTIVGGVKRGRLIETGAASAETIVVAGGHDHPVGATVIRRFDPNAIIDSLGTANLIYGEIRNGLPKGRDKTIALSLTPTGDAGIACLAVLELDAELAATGASEAEVLSCLGHDTLFGAPPEGDADLAGNAGGKIGIRRALERETLAARQRIAQMIDLGMPRGPIYATGGRARSRGFIELRASVFDKEIKVVDEMELSALGAAQFGAEAATGKKSCFLREKDIKTVVPRTEWVSRYNVLYQS